MGKYVDDKDAPPPLMTRLRPWLWGFTFFFVFCLTGVELGLDSHILHQHGNDASNYPSLEFKNIIGLILFTCIATLLYVVSHPWSGARMSLFWSFVFAVFWGTSAGVLNRVVPFEAHNCGADPSHFAPGWRPWQHQCEELVTLQAFAWTLWAVFLFKFIAFCCEVFRFGVKPRPPPFYRHKMFDTV
ncbi:magnesium transporter [Phanerochaete sordida]|uniref:Magnesium transporter n=1 Tax=Phanerochaete sordida TaxID=48140 RepID=A0A9P3G2G4_9APHY|nr:magnesium transporter [Phanerochaete sordida]